jgi:class 3 adenylate cyclase
LAGVFGSLRVKWTLAVLGVAVVPAAILGPIVLDIQRAGLGRAERELEAAVVDEAAGSVLGALGQASDVAERVARIVADDRIDVDGRTRMIGDVVARAPAISGVAFFDDQGHFVDAVVLENRAVDEALRSPPDLTGPPRGFQMGTDLNARIPRYVLREGGVVLVVPMRQDALTRLLADISVTRLGSPSRVTMVEESGRYLAGAAPGNNLPHILEYAGKSYGAPLVFTSEMDDGSERRVGTLRTMPEQRWAMIVERPADEAFGALASARRTFLLSLGVIAALAVALGLLVARRVLGPIGALMRLVGRYGRRDFSARSEVKSGDELETLGASLERMADDLAKSEREIEARARLEANLRRYMPAEAASAADLDLGGTRKLVTVVFADVVGFTGFAEGATPERAVAFLNELFTILSEIVFRHRGMVDKFIGDCVMAVFQPGPDGASRDDVARALAAAEDMHVFVESNLPRWRQAYGFRVELGIGVATGEVLVGNLGSASRMEYTVVGDVVNVAARLEALARPRQTLATREVMEASSTASFSSLGEHPIRGRAQAIEVFEVVA